MGGHSVSAHRTVDAEDPGRVRITPAPPDAT